MTDDAEKPAPKVRGRPWVKGQSGNPKGNHKGSRHKTTLLCEKMMDDEAERIVRAVITAATNGDMTAARLVLERLVPPRKDRPITFALPEIASAAQAASAMGAIIAAVAAGEISPDEGASVSRLIESFLKARELVEIEERLAALEAAKP